MTTRTGRWVVITRARYRTARLRTARLRTARLLTGAALSLTASFVAQPLAALRAEAPPSPAHAAVKRGAPATQRVMLMLRQACPLRARTSAGAACPAQAPVLAALRADGARVLATTSLVDSVTAAVSPTLAAALSRSPAISEVLADVPLASASSSSAAPSPPAPSAATSPPGRATTKPGLRAHGVAPASELCGTRSDPELDPEALQEIHATPAETVGFDGAGVTVAFLADGIQTNDPDFVRNGAYGPQGAQVIVHYQDFSGDGTAAVTDGAEAFGDASSIAAQGNEVYNLAEYVSPDMASVLPKGGCWARIVGAAPGASLLALKVIGLGTADGGTAGIVQALQYAVQHGAKVINESFGTEEFPDTDLDVLRTADDAAVAAGATVVVSSGDAGPTNTIQSPASDPEVISVGATTTFRSYAQSNQGGFYNPSVGNGSWANNNISSLSSGGYDQAGSTLDLVAPGDANWALCSTEVKSYTGCADGLGGKDIGVQNFGGTSEAAPLTAAAAADVIQAYAWSHAGADPPPSLVKQILCSTATDIGAPAAEQGAGLLNVAGAVKLAESLPSPPPTTATTTTTTSTTSTPTTTTTTKPTTTTSRASSTSTTSTSTTSTTASAAAAGSSSGARLAPGGARGGSIRPAAAGPQAAAPAGDLLIGPTQVNVVGQAGAITAQRLYLTNTGPATTTVHLSTRALTQKMYDTGPHEFTIDPAKPTDNTGTVPIWSGVTEVYQTESFTVPASSNSRLIFSADYQNTRQTSLLHFALFEPDGTYAAYSEPQGLADYAEVEVADPPAGRWTALFFTEQNGATKGGKGTKGTVQWDASTWRYVPASAISPSSLTIGPGHTVTATVSITNPRFAGDSDESVVVSSPGGQTTVPVTTRTMVPVGAQGGVFQGVLTGGNGRDGSDAQTNTYFFDVRAGKTDLDASVALRSDPGEALVGYLVDPDGQTVGYSSNYTVVPKSTSRLVPGSTRYFETFAVAPQAGEWELVLEWENPVTGDELTEPFSGAIRFDQVQAYSLLPDSTSTLLLRGQSVSVAVAVANTGVAPEAYFVDPRLDQTTTIVLKNLNVGTSASQLHLPPRVGQSFPLGIPLYLVPAGTTRLDASVSRLTGKGRLSFDVSPLSGDPDVSPGVPAAGLSTSSTPTSESLQLSEPELTPGLWELSPGEVGPYPPAGAPKVLAAAKVTAITQAFDTTVRSGADDLWRVGLKFSRFYYLAPGQSAEIGVTITPTAPVGTVISGTLYVDDFTLESFNGTKGVLPDADEVAALPYTYTVGRCYGCLVPATRGHG
ncbi:MAG: S8 family serine peptidase [Acidimicrobiales bacterium]